MRGVSIIVALVGGGIAATAGAGSALAAGQCAAPWKIERHTADCRAMERGAYARLIAASDGDAPHLLSRAEVRAELDAIKRPPEPRQELASYSATERD